MSRPGLPSRQDWLLRWFTWYCRAFYIPKAFTALRLARASHVVTTPHEIPLVVVCNHPSWWDPVVCAALSARWPDRTSYAPMDVRALKAYPMFGRLGFFPVEPGSVASARAFLETGSVILSTPGTLLWITAQGEFADPRRRPLELRGGLGHLLRRCERCVIVPLAIEYTFWNERLPEALVCFGEPLEVTDGKALSAADWTSKITRSLLSTMDALAALAIKRDPAEFETIVAGRTGVGGVYDWLRQIMSWCRGRRFVAGHDEGRSQV